VSISIGIQTINSILTSTPLTIKDTSVNCDSAHLCPVHLPYGIMGLWLDVRFDSVFPLVYTMVKSSAALPLPGPPTELNPFLSWSAKSRVP